MSDPQQNRLGGTGGRWGPAEQVNAAALALLESSTLLDEACQMRRTEPPLHLEGRYLRRLVER